MKYKQSPTYKPTIGLYDADSLIYTASYSCQTTRYHFVDNDGCRVSDYFQYAKDAKSWLNDEDDLGVDTEIEYTRVSSIKPLSPKRGYKILNQLMANYKALAGSSVSEHNFYLTPKGDKRKALKGIEKKYQGNRDNSVRPVNYEAIRDYALTLQDVKVVPVGYEADQILVGRGQYLGENAVTISIDKDMSIIENGWVIIVDKKSNKGVPIWNDSLGWLNRKTMKSSEKTVGGGFLYMLFLAVAGDNADGYSGCKGMGDKRVYELLKDCDSKKDAINTLITLYKGIYGEYYSFTSWDDQEITLHHTELLEQHIRMSFMQIYKGQHKSEFHIKEYLDG